MRAQTVRLCACGCGRPLPPGSHGNARLHPDCRKRIRKEQNRASAARSRATTPRPYRGAVRTWPDVHLPAIYGLEITAAAARLLEGASTQEYVLREAANGSTEYDAEQLADGARLLREDAQALLTALVRRLPASPTDADTLGG